MFFLWFWFLTVALLNPAQAVSSATTLPVCCHVYMNLVAAKNILHFFLLSLLRHFLNPAPLLRGAPNLFFSFFSLSQFQVGFIFFFFSFSKSVKILTLFCLNLIVLCRVDSRFRHPFGKGSVFWGKGGNFLCGRVEPGIRFGWGREDEDSV